jgi:hypothetical protein
MRSHFRISACFAIALLASSGSVMAQTGEFASPVPGSVVHAGYGLQDWLQDLRNGKSEPAPVEAVQDPVIIVPPQPEPAPVRPKKTAKKVTASSQVPPKQPQQ